VSATELLALRGIGLFAPSDPPVAPDLGLLPKTLRRGLSDGMKFAIDAAGRALQRAGRTGADLPIVFGSAIGETGTALELLTSITGSGESSPVLFRHSVHNATAGVLSIALPSLASSTAVAAGAETLLAALWEVGGLLREGAPAVLLVVAEEPPSPALMPGRTSRPGAVACVLERSSSHPGAQAYLAGPELGATPGAFAGDPLDPALALAHAVAEGQEGGPPVAIALSSRQPWRIRVARDRQALS
jgi:hypothetical protein